MINKLDIRPRVLIDSVHTFTFRYFPYLLYFDLKVDIGTLA